MRTAYPAAVTCDLHVLRADLWLQRQGNCKVDLKDCGDIYELHTDK